MTAVAQIAKLLDPLIDPQIAARQAGYKRSFEALSDEQSTNRDYLRGFKRSATYALDWAGDKLLIASRDHHRGDQYLRLYDLERSYEEREWQGEWMWCEVDPSNPNIAAVISWGGKFRVLDTRSSNTNVIEADLKKTSSSLKDFLFLCWSPSSRHIALNNRMDQVFILDLRGPDNKLVLGASLCMTCEVNQMAWAGSGGDGSESLWIAGGGSPGKLHVYPAPSLNKENCTSLLAHQHSTIALSMDRQGKQIASGGQDGLVSIWDPKHYICTRAFGQATQAVTALSLNKDSSLLAWGTGTPTNNQGGEKKITIVGADTGEMLWQDVTAAPVSHCKWHATKNLLVYALNVNQLPDVHDMDRGRDRDRGPRGMVGFRDREGAAVHTILLPDV